VSAPSIELKHVTKVYRRYGGRHFATLKSALLQRSLIRDLSPKETFTALDDVSLTVKPGQTYGIIGRNGSGKSTALKLIAGISKPTSGQVQVNGRISALIEIGAGFHPEISGRENVYINGIMLGLSKREVAQRFDEIVEFAELQDFIDAPVKTYSSGMYMRLGFSVAIHVDPGVLLVDEVLAVGDEAFTHKCLDKFAEFRRAGKTILLVTHALPVVERFCDEALWLDAGRARAHGDPRRVIGEYLDAIEQSEAQEIATATAKAVASVAHTPPTDIKDQRTSIKPGPETRIAVGSQIEEPIEEAIESSEPEAEQPAARTPDDMFLAAEGRWGSREIEITDVTLLDRDGDRAFIFRSGEPMTVRLTVVPRKPEPDFVFGISIFNADGVCCYGTNTWIEEMEPEELSEESQVNFEIESLDLVGGTYKLDVAVHTRSGYSYDYHRLLYTFRVKSRVGDVGICRPRHHWSFSPGVHFKERTVDSAT
jgi:ABC-type polysaccharide/polyol phosphate transport system ATPase subunit